MRYPLTTAREITNVDKNVEKREHLLGECNWYNQNRKQYRSSPNIIKKELPYDLAFWLLSMHLKELRPNSQRDIGTPSHVNQSSQNVEESN